MEYMRLNYYLKITNKQVFEKLLPKHASRSNKKSFAREKMFS